MNLSIIIPAYNHLDKVMTCLNSLQALASARHDYVVQDDASPEVYYPAVMPPMVARVGRNEVNLGFAGNVNAGAERAPSADVLFIVNQDVFGVPEWSSGWDAALLEAFNDPAVGIVGARLLFPNGCIQNAGGLFDAKKQPFHRCLGWRNPLHPECNTPETVSWTTGAAFAVRGELWRQLGGFDLSYGRGYFEDVDFCVRAQLFGWRVWYEPRLTLIHEVGSTGGNPDFLKNARYFIEKWQSVITPDEQAVRENFW